MTMRTAPSPTPTADADGDRDAQAPGPDRPARDGGRLAGDGHERGLRDGGAEADGGRKRVDPAVVEPVRGCALGEAEEGRVGQLGRHRLAEGEERLLQPDEEEYEPDHDIEEADGDPTEIRRALAQDDDLEEEHEADQRCDVQHRIHAGRQYEGNQLQCAAL